MRLVENLKRAWRLEKPTFVRAGTMNEYQRKGLRYERRVWSAVKVNFPAPLHYSAWFAFEDRLGLASCSTDILIERPDAVFVLECKLTFTTEAEQKLRGLYIPVVSAAFGRPAYGIVVARNLDRTARLLSADLFSAIVDAQQLGIITTVHWLGKAPLRAPPAPVSVGIATS